MGKRESNRSLPAFRLERSQKHYRRRQHVGSAEMYACQTFASRFFAVFSARLSFLTPRRQSERLARLHEQLRQAEQERGDRGTFHLKDGNGNVIPHKTE